MAIRCRAFSGLQAFETNIYELRLNAYEIFDVLQKMRCRFNLGRLAVSDLKSDCLSSSHFLVPNPSQGGEACHRRFKKKRRRKRKVALEYYFKINLSSLSSSEEESVRYCFVDSTLSVYPDHK